MGCVEVWCPKCDTIWVCIRDIKDVYLKVYKVCSKCEVNVKENRILQEH